MGIGKMTTQLPRGSKEFPMLEESAAGDAEGSGMEHNVGIVCVCLRWHPISFFYATY